MKSCRILLLFLAGFGLATPSVRAQDLNEQLEEAMKAAAAKVSPSVVQIVTQGGTDMVVITPKGPAFRKALGPTTGVIVAADGYVISSAFNFINSPTAILVSVPGHAEPYPAKKVATDRNRMLTLLKIEAKNLPVPAAVPLKDIREGQWSIALGRTLNAKREAPPSVSLGIISALGRIWGKALQTDAKISPVNYGGPIIDIQGRVQGILIPASPQVKEDNFGTDETAGFEWYDSGIGFAIPMEDILAVLPRLKLGKDLKPVQLRGILGGSAPVGPKKGPPIKIGGGGGNTLEGAVVVKQVAKDSAADRAGLRQGDVIIGVDGQPVQRMAQFRHIIGRKYEGDKVSLKFRRGDKEIELKEVELAGAVQIVAHPFLGILPMRDDPRLGVEVRFVYPKSPAERAGIVAGDRIVKYGTKELTPFTGPKYSRAQFLDFLNTLSPGNDIQLELANKDKTRTVTVKLANLGQDLPIPDKLEKGSLEKARTPLQIGKPAKVDPDNRKVEKGLIKRATPTGEHKYYLFVPDNYDPDVSHALMVWLHMPGKKEEKDFEDLTGKWEDLCEQKNMIILCPITENDNGWVAGDAAFIAQAVRDTMERYTIDRQRVLAHGMGVGGQMALFLGFNNRDLFRGVAAAGAVASHPRDNVKEQRLAFFLAGGSLDPLADLIGKSGVRLQEMHYPVFFLRIANRGREYLEAPQRRDLANWIDTLDKQ